MKREGLSWALRGPITDFYFLKKKKDLCCGVYFTGAPQIGPPM